MAVAPWLVLFGELATCTPYCFALVGWLLASDGKSSPCRQDLCMHVLVPLDRIWLCFGPRVGVGIIGVIKLILVAPCVLRGSVSRVSVCLLDTLSPVSPTTTHVPHANVRRQAPDVRWMFYEGGPNKGVSCPKFEVCEGPLFPKWMSSCSWLCGQSERSENALIKDRGSL